MELGSIFLAAVREKKPVICCEVRYCSERKRRKPSSLRAFLIDCETSLGSAFCPVCSSRRKMSMRYSFCFLFNRRLVDVCLRAHLIFTTEGILPYSSAISSTFSSMDAEPLSRFSAYRTIVLSRKDSLCRT